ncbi:MAG: transposase [Chitinophagales bacterium]
MYEEHFPEFITVTCYEWLPLIKRTKEKDIIIDSLRYLVQQNKINVHAFVLMDNHFHLIWRIRPGNKRADVQRDFLKHTAKQILINLQQEDKRITTAVEVNLKDRKYQVWQRNSLSIELRSESVFNQKLDYIHNNPVKAGICILAEDYKYSSASYYIANEKNWDFLTNEND